MIEPLIEAVVIFSIFFSLMLTLYPLHTYRKGGVILFLAMLCLLTAGVVRRLDTQWKSPWSTLFFHGIGLLGSSIFMFVISFNANRRMRRDITTRTTRLGAKS